MAIEVSDNIQSNSNKPTDNRYGPYTSVQIALNSENLIKAYRSPGLTIGIATPHGIVEYWWKNGLEDADLIEKIGTGNTDTAGLVKSVSVNNGTPNLPDGNGRVNLTMIGEGGFLREVEDFVYEGDNIFSLAYIPIRVYHVFPNGQRTKLFSNDGGEVTVFATMQTGWDVAIDYHHAGEENAGIFDDSFDDSFE